MDDDDSAAWAHQQELEEAWLEECRWRSMEDKLLAAQEIEQQSKLEQITEEMANDVQESGT